MRTLIIKKTSQMLAFGFMVLVLSLSSCKKEEITDLKVEKDEKTMSQYSLIESRSSDNFICELSTIKRSDITPLENTTVIELEDDSGFSVNGGVDININGIIFPLRGLETEFRFCENDNLESVVGKAAIPSPTDCIDFGDLIRTDIGFFTGDYVNNNFDLKFPLQPEQAYFVFFIGAQLGMEICTSGDGSTAPVTVTMPGGSGQLLFIIDFDDPFYFFEINHDLLGGIALAESAKGNIPFTPYAPIPEMPDFACNAFINCIDFSLFQVIEVSGDLYLNQSFVKQLAKDNPFKFDAREGFKAGINGDIALSLSVEPEKKKDDDPNDSGEGGPRDSTESVGVEFGIEIPLGKTSAALTAVPVQDELLLKAFMNTAIAPEGWWPSIIPFTPNAEVDVVGYVQQDGQFYILLKGAMGIKRADSNADIVGANGEIYVANDGLSVKGELVGALDGWAVEANVRKEQSDVTIEIPNGLLNSLNQSVEGEFDLLNQEIAQIQQLLEEAEDQLNIELSLRGLKDQIPVITAEAKRQLDAGVASAKSRARTEINRRIPRGFKICTSPYRAIDNWIMSIAAPYYRAINDLNAAFSPELNDEQVKVKLEAALRKLASLKTISTRKTFSFKVGPSRLKCRDVTSRTVSVSISFTKDVLTDSQVNQLIQAADNTQYIQPASDVVFNLKEQIGDLPDASVVVSAQAQVVPNLTEIGYIFKSSPTSFQFYVELDGQKHYRAFDPFDWKSITKTIRDFMIEQVEE